MSGTYILSREHVEHPDRDSTESEEHDPGGSGREAEVLKHILSLPMLVSLKGGEHMMCYIPSYSTAQWRGRANVRDKSVIGCALRKLQYAL